MKRRSKGILRWPWCSCQIWRCFWIPMTIIKGAWFPSRGHICLFITWFCRKGRQVAFYSLWGFCKKQRYCDEDYCEGNKFAQVCTLVFFTAMQTVEGLPTKAKEASPHKIRSSNRSTPAIYISPRIFYLAKFFSKVMGQNACHQSGCRIL